MEKHDFDVNVLAVLVEKVLEKVRHRLVGDVTADDNVPEQLEDEISSSQVLPCRGPAVTGVRFLCNAKIAVEQLFSSSSVTRSSTTARAMLGALSLSH